MRRLICSCCGDDLSYTAQEGFAICESCGTRQPVPRQDDEEKISLMNQADDLRKRFHYVEAMHLYSQIIAKYPDEAAAYFYLAISEFGIEYVQDHDGQYIPTFHRLPGESVQNNPNIRKAIETAGPNDSIEYEQRALELEMLRIRVLRRANETRKYDIFISFKQHTGDSDQTPLTWDYAYGNSLYKDLTEAGYAVFFSPVSLQGVAGEEYEPHIFSALQSAQVMLLLSSKEAYGESVWVKNEWQRFQELIRKGKDAILIPCYRATPSTLPADVKGLQGMDMDSVLTKERLLERIESKIPRKKQQTSSSSVDNNLESSLAYIRNLLSDGKFDEARTECDHAFRIDYHAAEAYMDLALVEYQFKSLDEVRDLLIGKVEQAESSGYTLSPSDTWKQRLVDSYTVKGYFDEKDIKELLPESTHYRTQLDGMQTAKKNWCDQFFDNENVQKAYENAQGDYKEQIQQFKADVEDQIGNLISLAEQQKQQDRSQASDLLNKRKAEAEDQIKARSEEATVQREADYQAAMKASNEDDAEKGLLKLIVMGDYKEAKNRKKDLEYIYDTLKAIKAEPNYLARQMAQEQSQKVVDYINQVIEYKNMKAPNAISTMVYVVVQVVALLTMEITAMHMAGAAILILGLLSVVFLGKRMKGKGSARFVMVILVVLGNAMMGNIFAIAAAVLAFYVLAASQSLLAVFIDRLAFGWQLEKTRNTDFLSYEQEKRKEIEDNWQRILGISFDHSLKPIADTMAEALETDNAKQWALDTLGIRFKSQQQTAQQTATQQIRTTKYVITLTKIPKSSKTQVIDAVVRYTNDSRETIQKLADNMDTGGTMWVSFANEQAAQTALTELQQLGVSLSYESKTETQTVTK